MLKEILAISGKSGLFRFVSKAKNMSIVESLVDKKRIPAYPNDKIISLGDISIFTEGGETSIHDVFTTIKEKEGGKSVSLDLINVKTEELRDYFAEILPDFDRERVYPSDIKKIFKWYDLLIANGITDFSKEETDKDSAAEVKGENETPDEVKDDTKTTKATTKSATSTKRKETSLTSAKSVKTPKTQSVSKNAVPKKSVVGSKRGS